MQPSWSTALGRVLLTKRYNILKLEDIYGLELAKYMHQLHNNKLPFSLFEDYVKPMT